MTWELSFVLFEFYTQTGRMKNQRYYDIFLMCVQSIGMLFTVVACFLPLLRFKFAHPTVEFVVRLLISMVAFVSAMVADFSWGFVVIEGILFLLCILSYGIFYSQSWEYRLFEESERQEQRHRQHTEVDDSDLMPMNSINSSDFRLTGAQTITQPLD